MTTIYTVDVAKFHARETGDQIGTVDVCRDDDGYVHWRINNGTDEIVMKLDRLQARRVRNMLDAAIDGLVAMSRL